MISLVGKFRDRLLTIVGEREIHSRDYMGVFSREYNQCTMISRYSVNKPAVVYSRNIFSHYLGFSYGTSGSTAALEHTLSRTGYSTSSYTLRIPMFRTVTLPDQLTLVHVH
jgi:hypothetical protein